MDKLKNNFKELTDTFLPLGKGVLGQIGMSFYKNCSYPEPGQNLDRYLNRKSINGRQLNLINRQILISTILWTIKEIPVVETIYNQLILEKKIFFKFDTFKKDLNTRPSIPFNIIASFLSELIEETGDSINYVPEKFETTFSELEDFLTTDTIDYTLLVGLYGPFGDNEYEIDDDIAIKRASYEISKLFILHYQHSLPMEYEMFENDYYIEIKKNVDKTNFYKYISDESLITESLYNSLIFSLSGNIEIGKKLSISKYWMLIRTEQLEYSSRYNKYNETNQFIYKMNDIDITNFIERFKNISKINFNELDRKIQKSYKRLKKSKAITDIEDKIIELILSIEYLINTNNHEVNLQLRLKILSFIREVITDKKKLYKDIQEFLTLRGDVIHGNKEVTYISKNLNLIQTIENIQAQILYKFILLNQRYTFDQINEALTKSLYEFNTIENILQNDCG